MKLTQDQIEHLYNFTRQHYVEWYDLQTELVDHLANGIEQIWDKNPKLTFEEALQIEFKKFGVFGFMNVVEAKQKFLSKKYNGLILNHFKTFFTFPKIILTVAFIIGFYIIFQLSKDFSKGFIMGYFLTLALISVYLMIENRRAIKKKKILNEKRWLLEEIINRYGNLVPIVYLPFNIFSSMNSFSGTLLSNNYYILGISCIMTLFSIFIYIIFKIIPAKTELYLKELYPEYNIN